MCPGRGIGFRRPAGANCIGIRFRWLAPPANIQEPFGLFKMKANPLNPPYLNAIRPTAGAVLVNT
jgi:hypothetical protein